MKKTTFAELEVTENPRSLVQILSSGFKPGKFKNAIFLWIGLCLGAILLGKLTNNALTFYAVPAMITVFFFIILALVYQVKKPKETKKDNNRPHTRICPKCHGPNCHEKAVSLAWTDYECPDCGYYDHVWVGVGTI